MRPHKGSLTIVGASIGLALTLLGATASAQSQSGKAFARYNKSLRSVALDLETGTLTHGPAVHDKNFATCINFDNIDLGGFAGVDTGNKFCEWWDAGQTSACSPTEIITSIVFAYCSATQDVGSGGVGGSARLGFYEGYTVGGGAPVTTCAVFTLTGLPGNTADSSFFGGFRCYFILVTFNPLISCGKGRIAYSWHFMDLGRDGVLASTFPFLSCVQSCSGTGPDGKGMVDLIDEYCPSGQFPPRATFSFGTTPFGSYFTSMSMQIRKLVGQPSLVNQFMGDNRLANVCNVCSWCGAVDTSSSNAVTGDCPPLAAAINWGWAPQVQLNAIGAHAHPPAPNGGIHPVSGAQLCAYFVSLNGMPVNGPCPATPFAPYTARVELGISGPITTSIIGTIVGPPGQRFTSINPINVHPSALGYSWACYANIITGSLRCRSKTLFGVVGTCTPSPSGCDCVDPPACF